MSITNSSLSVSDMSNFNSAAVAAPVTNVENTKEETVNDPIVRQEGSRHVFSKGKDYEPVKAIVIASRYSEAKDGEKQLYISQNKGTGGISISLNTLEEILKWAKMPDEEPNNE